jgi:hypothetical protein
MALAGNKSSGSTGRKAVSEKKKASPDTSEPALILRKV